MAKHASQNGNSTIVADIENLPLKNNSFDLIISSLAVQWTDLEQVLKNIKRVLTDSGRFLIATVGNNSFIELKKIAPDILFENMQSKEEILTICNKLAINNITVTSYQKKQYFASSKDFFISLKKIGAGYKSATHKKYLGKNFFIDLEDKYKKNFPQQDYFTISWEILVLAHNIA